LGGLHHDGTVDQFFTHLFAQLRRIRSALLGHHLDELLDLSLRDLLSIDCRVLCECRSGDDARRHERDDAFHEKRCSLFFWISGALACIASAWTGWGIRSVRRSYTSRWRAKGASPRKHSATMWTR